MSIKAKAAIARMNWLNEHFVPNCERTFQAYPQVRSIALCVAQYWNDEADDAVHSHYILSALDTPVLHEEDEMERWEDIPSADYPYIDPNWAGVDLGQRARCEWNYGGTPHVSYSRPSLILEMEKTFYQGTSWSSWDSNGAAIPMWAAWCKEGSNQEMSAYEAHNIAVIAQRDEDGEVTLEFTPMLRPNLDGIRPEYWDEDDEVFEDIKLDTIDTKAASLTVLPGWKHVSTVTPGNSVIITLERVS